MSKWNNLSFFKILVGDQVFTKLKLPPAFLKNLKRIKFPSESTISLMYHPNLSWKVKMEIIEVGGDVYFTEGWDKLWKDIKLEIGDFLVFYLARLDEYDAYFQLRAFDQTCRDKMWECYLSSTSSEKNKVMSVDDDDDDLELVPNYPFFQNIITRASLNKSTMHVPRIFSRSYVNRSCRKQILTFETSLGQSWPVVLTANSSMSGGLSKFLKDNSVQVGNICTFKLYDSKEMLFRVYIKRGNHGIPQYVDNNTSLSKTSSNMSSEGIMHGKLDFSDVRPQRLGSGFTSNYPFFQVNITTDILYRKRLPIPWAFAKDNMDTTAKTQLLTLQTAGGLWPVKLTIQSNPNQARLYGGIPTFMKENNVKVGDLWTFELVNKIDLVFRSSIYRDQTSSKRYVKDVRNCDFVYY